MTCVTNPHDEKIEPICPLADYDLGAYVRKAQEAQQGLRRNKSSSKLLSELNSNANLEPASVRKITYYRPTYNPLTDETDSSNIESDQSIDQSLLTLFEETLRLSGRKTTRPFGKAFFKAVKNHF